MPRPQWKEPTTGLEGQWGFDGTATPAWFMVPHGVHHGDSKTLRLDFANGKLVKSVNPRIADITEQSPDPQSRFFDIAGKMPGRARIEVRDPKTNALESVLEVSVKHKKPQRISFHFAEDRGGNRTIRQPNIVDGLIDDLNGIYKDQTNITFELGWTQDIKLDIHLIDVVAEEKDAKTKVPTGEGHLIGKRTWEGIFAKKNDGLADFNIYFVPTNEPADKNLNVLPYTDISGNCVIEDGAAGLDIILPHAVGRMSGCPPDFSNRQLLMFFDFVIRRDGNFIPKACANIMNRSGV